MADLPKLAHGEPNWDTKVNDLIDKFNLEVKKGDVSSDPVDVTISNGWTKADGGSYVKAFPLANGTTLKAMQLNIQNSSVQGGVNFGSIVTVPNEFGTAIARPVGSTTSVEVDGHFQGFYEWSFADFNHLGGHYVPNDGQGGPFNITLRATILYF